MAFAKAFERPEVKKSLEKKLGIEVKKPKNEESPETSPEKVPMMYRAQVPGRCSLQYGKNQKDLNRWTEEWVYPNENDKQKPHYQYQKPQLGMNGSTYRFELQFTWRVFSNCGQDSILRPVIDQKGIPIIPGSSIKGLFKRLLNNPQVSEENKQKIQQYCGSIEEPGTLRFIRAYPVGDWASTKQVTPANQPKETRYQMVDICHPQQARQVEGKGSPKAIALISLHQPTLIFELSSIQALDLQEWKNIEGLLKRALRPGLGGKTSTGYGLYTFPQDRYPIQVYLKGKGVSPLLRNDEPEFRPNLFKATLRGHVARLLGGVSSDEKQVKEKIGRLFGHTGDAGNLKIYWESRRGFPKHNTLGKEKTPTYEIEGTLYLDIEDSQQKDKDLKFIRKVLQFTLIMGGLGKSWRRVWHEDFFPSYRTRAIGCHWTCLEDDFINVSNPQELKNFLGNLYQACQEYMGLKKAQAITRWRESWHPEQVRVYSKVVQQSQIIRLFHDKEFKNTPEFGVAEILIDQTTGKEVKKLCVSCVWHRMLPLTGGEYLEIVTIFKGNDRLWQGVKQDFMNAITQQGFVQTWGN